MYLHNKYTRCYFNIIRIAKSRSLLLSYSEKHHIVPKSLGGSNDPSNIVTLTAREHFICHLLLTKMTTGPDKQKMSHAAWAIANQKRSCQDRYSGSSRTYETLRVAHAALVSARHTGKIGPNRGKLLSEETKKRMSVAAKGRKPSAQAVAASILVNTGRAPVNKGKPMSDVQKEKIRAAALLRWRPTK